MAARLVSDESEWRWAQIVCDTGEVVSASRLSLVGHDIYAEAGLREVFQGDHLDVLETGIPLYARRFYNSHVFETYTEPCCPGGVRTWWRSVAHIDPSDLLTATRLFCALERIRLEIGRSSAPLLGPPRSLALELRDRLRLVSRI